MTHYKLISWNVNGLRAIVKKDFWKILEELNPDVLALQETKSDDEIMKKFVVEHPDYKMYWHSNQIKKGYSGVATLTKIPVEDYCTGFKIERFDQEGRVVKTKFKDFTFFNIYFPNGGQGPHRVDYKIEFYDACLAHMEELRQKGEKVVIAGDFNTAHHEIDLHDPKGNQKTTGFLPIERAWLDKLVEHNYIDTYRYFHPDKADMYTWWDMRSFSRPKNKGWRIDYFFIAPELKDNLKSASILTDVYGSDHCPLGIELEF
ncbi:MAG: exodeoxyribonuclease III [Candidatus Caenarcaniphilales bacterium]|nr:exodeoxyribonuclease III [Candidatus Caenarcaniphilales bacterium]